MGKQPKADTAALLLLGMQRAFRISAQRSPRRLPIGLARVSASPVWGDGLSMKW